jgi:hypothetical protein
MTTARLQALLRELGRRRVARAAAVYGTAAFVVVQAADVVFPRLALPDWTVTLVVALALLGLVPALALAWLFDATPDGMRRTALEAKERWTMPIRDWPVALYHFPGVSREGGALKLTAIYTDFLTHPRDGLTWITGPVRVPHYGRPGGVLPRLIEEP